MVLCICWAFLSLSRAIWRSALLIFLLVALSRVTGRFSPCCCTATAGWDGAQPIVGDASARITLRTAGCGRDGLGWSLGWLRLLSAAGEK